MRSIRNPQGKRNPIITIRLRCPLAGGHLVTIRRPQPVKANRFTGGLPQTAVPLI
jgi:hypothetical protein